MKDHPRQQPDPNEQIADERPLHKLMITVDCLNQQYFDAPGEYEPSSSTCCCRCPRPGTRTS